MKVVVIGCGVIGAAIAYELSQYPQCSITVLEKQPFPAQASSGAALGVLMGAISQKPKGNNLRMRLFGIQQYNQWIPDLETVTGRRIPFNKQGILRLCFEGEELDRWHTLVKIRQEQGWELQIYDRNWMAHHYPHINLDRVRAAIYSPADRQVDPTALTQALVDAAAKRGVTFHFGTTVETIVSLSEFLQLGTSNGLIEADWIVVAAGLGSTPLTSHLQSSVDIRPVLGQAIRVQLPSALGNPYVQPVITGEDVHIVPLGSNEYWVGATVEFPNTTKTSQEIQLQPDADLLETVMQQAIALCPALKNATIRNQWYGLRPRPEGRPAPVIEALSQYPNIILATGHYRNGVLLAPATAQKVREAILPIL